MGLRVTGPLAGSLCVTTTIALATAGPALGANTVNLSLAGSTGDGTITSEPAGINCTVLSGVQSGTCSTGSFADGTSVTLTASPKPTPSPRGSTFLGWTTGSGTCNGLATPSDRRSPCEFTTASLGGTVNLAAKFVPTPEPPTAVSGGNGPGPDPLLLGLQGFVNPHGFKLSECRFEYDTRPYGADENPHGTKLACVPAASSILETATTPQPVSATVELEQLVPGATYHYRLFAANLGGEGEGVDRQFATPAPPPDPCPNAAIRDAQPLGAILLPGCMALEQASPVNKDSQPVKSPVVFGADGERLRFTSNGALAGSPSQLFLQGEPYVAGRTGSGWQTAFTRTPAELSRGWLGGARGFSSDLSHWFQVAATVEQGELGISQAFDAGLGGLFAPLSPLMIPQGAPSVGSYPPFVVINAALQGASADRSHLFIAVGGDLGSVDTAYLAGDPVPAGGSAIRNAYVAHLDQGGDPSLKLLARDTLGPDAGKAWGGTCGARLAPGRGAVSADGARAYIVTRPGQANSGFCNAANRQRTMVRTETSAGIQIEELVQSECARISPPCKSEAELNGDDAYLGASLDQSRVYLASVRQLTSSDEDTTSDVYLYDSSKPAGSRLTRISAGGNVGSLFALSGDGTRAYFVSNSALVAAPDIALPAGQQTPTAGQPNLYLWNYATGQTAFVATLVTGDSGAYPVPLVGANPLLGGDGHLLVFNTRSSLSPSDADGGKLDIYRYDSTGPAVICITCRPGAPDAEPFDASGVASPSGSAAASPDFAEEGRRVSEDGQAVLFSSAEPYGPGDVNGAADSFLWRAGQVYRLPGVAESPALDHAGSSLAFIALPALLSSDGDSTRDIYVAREGGGFPVPVPSTPCAGEACQAPFPPAPAAASAASEVSVSGDEPSPRTRGCANGKVRRHGVCVKRRSGHKRQRQKAKTKSGRAGR